jgi:hypothetical protein
MSGGNVRRRSPASNASLEGATVHQVTFSTSTSTAATEESMSAEALVS